MFLEAFPLLPRRVRCAATFRKRYNLLAVKRGDSLAVPFFFFFISFRHCTRGMQRFDYWEFLVIAIALRHCECCALQCGNRRPYRAYVGDACRSTCEKEYAFPTVCTFRKRQWAIFVLLAFERNAKCQFKNPQQSTFFRLLHCWKIAWRPMQLFAHMQRTIQFQARFAYSKCANDNATTVGTLCSMQYLQIYNFRRDNLHCFRKFCPFT